MASLPQGWRLQTIAQALEGLPHVTTERIWPRQGAWMHLCVTCDEARMGKSLASICEALGDGDPSARVGLEDGQIHVDVHTLKDGENEIVAKRLREVFSG